MDQPQLSDDVSKCPYYPCSFYVGWLLKPLSNSCS
jgi:hypothetical protein